MWEIISIDRIMDIGIQNIFSNKDFMELLKKICSINSYYVGIKKYKVFNFLGFQLKVRVRYKKHLRGFILDSKPKPHNNTIEQSHKKVYLSIVAIFKDEPDIVEWIEYHLLAGVERFYLYDNDSISNYEEKLKKYIEKGFVIYKKVHGRCMQSSVYRDAVYRYKNETEWLAIIDLDEYILPIKTNDIKDLLKEYNNYCGLVCNWIMFDCNDVNYRSSNRTTLDLYTRTYTNKQIECQKTVKSIVKPAKVRYVGTHVCIYKNNEIAVDEDFNPQITELYCHTDKVLANKICINHYHCKSQEDYLSKINKGFADRKQNRKYNKNSLYFKEGCHNYIIFKYLKNLYENLGKKESIS